MIMADSVRDLILKMDVFMTKKGQDMAAKRDLIKAINCLEDEDSLDAIYVNNTENFNIPDVAVIPLYNKDFNIFLSDGDLNNTCPFGYTIEIHERCFTKYTPEELTAVVIHDILQNVMSSTAKVRFIKAYNAAISEHDMDHVLKLFDDMSNAEVTFMIFMDICTRPFKVPVVGEDYVGTDEVLNSMNLGDAYDSYLEKTLPMSQDTPDDRIEQETKNDYRTAHTIIAACMDHDIRHYYTMIRSGVPMVTLDNIFSTKGTIASLGFISKKRDFKKRYQISTDSNATIAMTESFMNPKSEIELRFQVDKIISDMRYAETEPEREVILIKIKNLSIRLTKTKLDLDKKFQKAPQDQTLRDRIEFIQNLLDELELLRQQTVKMEIKEKRYGVFVKYPANYTENPM